MHSFAAIAVHTVTQKEDASKDHEEKAQHDQKKDHSIVIRGKNQNIPNRRIDSNKINGRQLPTTSPVYHNSRSRTQYRSQSRNNSNNNLYNRDNQYYQGYRNSNNNYNNRSGSYNRNN